MKPRTRCYISIDQCSSVCIINVLTNTACTAEQLEPLVALAVSKNTVTVEPVVAMSHADMYVIYIAVPDSIAVYLFFIDTKGRIGLEARQP